MRHLQDGSCACPPAWRRRVIWEYAAAKAGLVGPARTLVWDAWRDGALVNLVATGFTRTDRTRERFGAEIFDRVGSLVPQRRTSTAEDVAQLVIFLGSAANASITGEVVREGTAAARTRSQPSTILQQ